MSDTVNRRDFLAAGAAAAGTLALQSRIYAQTSQTVKVGLIGCGGRGTGAIRNILDADKDVQITALCDVFETKVNSTLKSIKKRYQERVTATPDTCFHGL